MSKAREDLLLPIRTVEEVRNVRCAAFQRAPSIYSGSIAVFFFLAIEIAIRVPKHDEGARRVDPLAITPGAKSVYGFRTRIPFRDGFREKPCGDYPIRLRYIRKDSRHRVRRGSGHWLQRAKVLDGLAQAVFKRHARFPTQYAACLPDVGFALFGIVLRQRLVNDA